MLTGVDLLIVLVFGTVGWIVWRLMGATKHEKKVLLRQIFGILLLGLVAGGVALMYHLVFLCEPVFSKNSTGILVMRLIGDDGGVPHHRWNVKIGFSA